MADKTLSTHVPVMVDLPPAPKEVPDGRKYAPPPTVWQEGVKVYSKTDRSLEAAVYKVDHYTRQFRPMWLASGELAPPTHWERWDDWEVVTDLSPAEKERQAARGKLEDEIAKLSPEELAAVEVFLDGDDPLKALAKLKALRTMGVLKGSVEALTEAKKK